MDSTLKLPKKEGKEKPEEDTKKFDVTDTKDNKAIMMDNEVTSFAKHMIVTHNKFHSKSKCHVDNTKGVIKKIKKNIKKLKKGQKKQKKI